MPANTDCVVTGPPSPAWTSTASVIRPDSSLTASRAAISLPSAFEEIRIALGSEVTVDGQTVRIRRDGDTASETIEGTLPLVLSVSDQANEPRYPSFKGIMAAKKKPVETWSLADLELSGEQVGQAGAWTEVTEVTARPARTAGTIVADEDGSGAAQLVEFLSTNKFL